MTITLNPKQEAIVREQIASGQFASADDVISESLRLLDVQRDPLPVEEMRRELAIAAAQEERGEVAELDIEEIIAKGRVEFMHGDQRR